jgi:hypothetical protein
VIELGAMVCEDLNAWLAECLQAMSPHITGVKPRTWKGRDVEPPFAARRR